MNLEETIRYHSELRGGDEIDISCAFAWGSGKTFRVDQEFRLPDGSLVAEVANTGGLLDRHQRRLVTDPGERWRSVATAPEVLGL